MGSINNNNNNWSKMQESKGALSEYCQGNRQKRAVVSSFAFRRLYK